MRIDKLTLDGWRNYRRQTLDFDGSCNVIYGENAQGKTNLLEAMVYLSCGKSPRAHGDRELIGFDRQEASRHGAAPVPGAGVHHGDTALSGAGGGR